MALLCCMCLDCPEDTPNCRYTLGGFYLARYSDSPVGKFDEVKPSP